MKSVVRLLAVAAGCLLAYAAPATAQYMYLDVNGDGVNTTADVLTPSTTGVDVWLRTNVNRDATTASCNTSGNSLDLASYDFFLRSSGGVIEYGTWTNDPSVAFPTSVGDFASGTDAYHGRCCGAVLAAGTYKLGRQALTSIATGAKLDIVGSSSINPAGFTSFGTACEGNDFDNTYKFGSDWFDADGTTSAGGGNSNPIIVAPLTASGSENAAFSVTATASDPDAGNTVTLSQTNNSGGFLPSPSSAGPVATPSLTLTGTPNFSQSGSYTVSWTAADNTTGTAAASTAVTIDNTNRVPVITRPATASGTENVAFSVTASASDADAQNVRIAQTNDAPFLPPATSAGPALNPSLTLTGTPDFSAAGSYTVNWTATDNNSPAGSATPLSTVITIADVAQNQNPVISAPATASGTENSAFSVTGSASDPDAGQLVTLSQTNGAPFLTASSSAGPLATPSITLSGTPNFTQAGSYTVNWTAVDNNSPAGTATPASTVITIANLNRNPVITAPATASGTENAAFSVTGSASDPDVQNVTLSQTNGAPFLTASSSNGPALNPSITLSGTPNTTQAGSYTVNWTAVDVNSPAGTATPASTVITIADVFVNQNPVISAPATASGTENSAFSATGSASDPDAGQLVTLSQTNGAPFLTASSSAGPLATPSITLSGTPNFTQAGSYTVNWTAVDNFSPAGSATPASTVITIANLNRNPVITAPTTASGATGSPVSVTGSASDADGQNVTLSQTNNTPFFTASSSAGPSLNPSITLSATPTLSQAGTYTVNWTAVDVNSPAGSATPVATILTITTGDIAPVLAAIGPKTIFEGANTDYPISATDVDGDLITISASLPSFGALNAPTTGTGSVTTSFNLAPGFSAAGSYTGTVTATANGIPDSETFDITVANTNRPPSMPAVAPITVAEGASASTPVTATDADGDLISLSVVSLPSFAVLNAPLTGTGSVTTSITATPGFSDAGSHSGSVRATDPSNADATSGVSITVTNTDQPPSLATIADVIVGQGGSASRNVDATDPDGDVVEISATLPAFATLNPPVSGVGSVATTISINPTAGTTTGDYPASVTATAILLSDIEEFTITVTRTNQVIQLDPIADVSLDEGFTSFATVNASDADNDLITLSASLPGFATLLAPTSGTGTVTTTVSITPGFDDAGSYPSSVTATDGIQPVTEPFLITVGNVDRPVALDPIADLNVAEGASASRSVSAVDPDNDAITLTAGLPAFASLTDNGDGTGSVDATPGFTDSGSYPSSVTATANGTTATENFSVIVADVDRPPVLAAIANINVQEGASANTAVSATDADGETITLNASLPSFATLDAPTSGAGSVSTTVTASPAPGDAGSYPSSVTATANGQIDTENFTISVGQPNQVPGISAPATETVNEGVNLNFIVTATDGDDDPLTLTAGGTPGAWTFQDNGNGTGTFDWTPGFNAAGPYTINFTANDGRGGTNSASTEITVINVNRCPTASTGGPYTGAVNFPVSFNGSASSDPDGDPLTYAWTFGDGGSQTGATPTHTYTSGGAFTVTLVVDDGVCAATAITTATIVTEFPAAIFTVGGNNTTMLASGKPTTCVQIEPMGDSFDVSGVDLSTIVMISEGTGSVSEISAMGKTTIDGDKNSNGTTEIRACFSKEDLRLLFSLLPAGKNTVTVEIEGNLTTGGRFHGELTHTVKATGGPLAASVSPNPLNPETTLAFQVGTPGRVTVKIFDLNGRLVKTLLDDIRGAGYQQLDWDGTSNGGAKVPSGVYFFRLDTPSGRQVLTATVLK